MTVTDILIADMLQRLETVEELLTRERQLLVCSIFRSTSQTISVTSWEAASFSSAIYDPFGLWSAGDPTKIITSTPGYYMAVGAVKWEADSSTTIVQIRIRKNDTSAYGISNQLLNSVTGNPRMQVWSITPIPMAVNDYVTLEAYHDLSGGLDIQVEAGAGTYFTLWKVIS